MIAMYASVREYVFRLNPIFFPVGFAEDEQSKQDMVEFWTDCFKQRMSLVALAKGGEGTEVTRIAGCNMLSVCKKDDIHKQFSGTTMNILLKSMDNIAESCDVYSRHGINEYLSAYGLSVSPRYSGDGVGYQLLRAREPLCKATGVKLTGTVFSGDVSQHLAAQAGFTTVRRQQYDQFSVDGQIIFKRLNKKTYAFMEKLFV